MAILNPLFRTPIKLYRSDEIRALEKRRHSGGSSPIPNAKDKVNCSW